MHSYNCCDAKINGLEIAVLNWGRDLGRGFLGGFGNYELHGHAWEFWPFYALKIFEFPWECVVFHAKVSSFYVLCSIFNHSEQSAECICAISWHNSFRKPLEASNGEILLQTLEKMLPPKSHSPSVSSNPCIFILIIWYYTASNNFSLS